MLKKIRSFLCKTAGKTLELSATPELRVANDAFTFTAELYPVLG